MNWKEKALESYGRIIANKIDDRERRREADITILLSLVEKWTGVKVSRSKVQDEEFVPMVEVDSVRFALITPIGATERPPIRQLAVVGTCPSCGMTAPSKPILRIEDLGEALSHWYPGNNHQCIRQNSTAW